jgi:signal recognition particle subunit SRP54
MLGSIQSSFTDAFKKLRTRGKLARADVEAILADIRVALIDADVAVSVVDTFLDGVLEKTADIDQSKSIKPAEMVVKAINDELVQILGQDVERPLARAKQTPTIYMLIGLQGAGKTTLAGKLGYHLKKNGHTPLLVAADLQRPGAVAQLEITGEKAGVPVFAPERGVGEDAREPAAPEKKGLFGGLFGGRDVSKGPVDVAKMAVEEAKNKLYDTIIIDTAGRLGVDDELLAQASEIKQAVNPDEVLFVLDSTTGQDAVNSVLAFDQSVGFTASVLTKFDSDARGGAALSLTQLTGKPILFAGVGETFEDLEVFHPDRVASRILDQGDILTLLEQAQDKVDEEVTEAFVQKLVQGEDFDFNDFLAQMEQIQKMGSVKSLMNMLPGMGQYKQAIDNFDDSEIGRIKAIIQSMTPWERANPTKFTGTRKARVAAGSGASINAVNQLLERFKSAQKMMSKMMGGSKKGGKNSGLLHPKNLAKMNQLDELMDQDPNPDPRQINELMGDLNLNQLMGGMNMGGMNMPGGFGANRSNSARKSKNSKGKKGKSGNPAKRAAQEAQLRAKFQS